ncbi:DnaJ homolog dnj-10 [Caenorhabditis elegans]|uniref:Isoform b of DnaJ homolog dnj-10 n=1 Tax=Caenorhabditis elegans TaxID=6239 RepID=Q8TA83-2|nr:DnaJ homolog dnj-10 [Caenorhabditis elegans]CCD62136.1 DnaJ homolog dnj-10 [Caenorhabditis elegans]|eukprot:NP_498901.1 DnaJ homolog dnj-10 [Caenorhabditis elegans]
MFVLNRSSGLIHRSVPLLAQVSTPTTSTTKLAQLHTTHALSKEDYYKTLGVDKKSDAKAIKKAYFQLAKKYHPDVNKTKEAQTKFQEISEAYEVLSDDTKRQEYDAYGSGGGPAGGRGGAGGFHHHGNVDVNEIFRRAFGGGGGMGGFNFDNFAQSAFGHSAAQEMVMDISFEEAVRGATKNVSVNVVEDCLKCHGTQVEPGHKKTSCPYCNGTGAVSQRLQGGFFYQTTCNRCRGSGHYNKNPCQECEGEGQTVQRRQVSFNVPAGTNNGDSLKFQVGKNQLFVRFNVAPSLKFRREKDDIHCDVDISLAQAVLGGTVKVPGINGDTYVHIPAGTGSHTKMRLTGKGVKRLHSYGNGDQYMHIKVTVPKYLTAEQKQIMLAWAATEQLKDGTIKGLEKNQKTEEKETKKNEEKKSEDKSEEKSESKEEPKNEESSETPEKKAAES